MLVASLRQLFAHSSPLQTTRRNFSRPISTVTFAKPMELRKKPSIRQEAISLVWKFSAISGLDKAGADSISISGSFHKSLKSGALHSDKYERLTASVYDKRGVRLYFRRITDQSFWDRVHVPRNTKGAHWPAETVYVKTTEQKFHKMADGEGEREADSEGESGEGESSEGEGAGGEGYGEGGEGGDESYDGNAKAVMALAKAAMAMAAKAMEERATKARAD